jgi:hypothetical protein
MLRLIDGLPKILSHCWINEFKNGIHWMQQLRQSQGFGKEGMEIYQRNLTHHKEKRNCCIGQNIVVDLVKSKRVFGQI